VGFRPQKNWKTNIAIQGGRTTRVAAVQGFAALKESSSINQPD
jgi:hypothetical protein